MAPRHAGRVAWARAGPAAFLIVSNRDHGPAPVRRRSDAPQPAGQSQQLPQARRRAMFARMITPRQGPRDSTAPSAFSSSSCPAPASCPGSKAITCSPTPRPARSSSSRCGRPASRWMQSPPGRGRPASGTSTIQRRDSRICIWKPTKSRCTPEPTGLQHHASSKRFPDSLLVSGSWRCSHSVIGTPVTVARRAAVLAVIHSRRPGSWAARERSFCGRLGIPAH